MRKATALLATATAIAFAGCTALPKASDYNMDWLTEMASPDQGPATQIVAMWTDASLKQAGSPVTRGFGGRIYIYDAKQRTVEANGELIVYAFVEHDRQPPSKLPDRKFVFTAEELKEHYSKTALGHSYSIWLPWDQAGDETVSVSLLPTFKPADEKAKAVMGAPSLNVLKGKKEREAGLDKMEVTSSSGVRPVAYHEEGEETEGDASTAEGESSRRRVSIYDPQTNVSVGPLPKMSDVTAASFDNDLPQASGVNTTTIDLTPALSLAMKNAPPVSRNVIVPTASAPKGKESEAKAGEPANGTVFDLAGAAALANANAEAKLLSKMMGEEALKAGVTPSTSRFSKGQAAAGGEDEAELKINRFNSRKRSGPSWDRNRPQRW